MNVLKKNNYPPVRIDNARNELSNKIDFVKKMSLLGCKFISPSLHVAKSFNMQYSHIGISECRVINNGFDIDSENFISTLSLEKKAIITKGKKLTMIRSENLQ